MNKLISICLATYNGEKYLKEQLASLCHQTYKNIEIIIQDDCSSDGTRDIIKNYNAALNIKLFSNEKNLGYIKNFESVLQKATGDYIAICDQDDIWEHDKLEVLVKHLGEATLIYSDSLLIDAQGKSLHKRFSQSLKNNFISTTSPLPFLYDNCVSGHALLFKKELLNYIFPFPNNVFFDAWIAANASSLHGIKYYNVPLVQYRQHATNTLSKHHKEKTVDISQKIKNKAQKKLDNVQAKILAIENFLKLPLLKKEEKEILQTLQLEYSRFETLWFNFSLFSALWKHKNLLFPITKKNLFRLILKESIGYKTYKALPIL
ncbi:MAG: glycosyltransferase family 2 protein [Arcobacteraceae bacterium]|jgi:glycosyltransferase involved in cell wall biosynthesis